MLDGGWFREHDVDDVEADLHPIRSGPANVIAGGAQQAVPLVGIDGAVGTAKLVGLAGLHFHEHEHLAVPSDDVQFAHAGTRPVVPRHDNEASLLQVPVREILAASAAGLVSLPDSAPAPMAQGVRGAVEQRKHLFTNFELELDHLSSNQVAQVVFPETAEAVRPVHKQFESGVPP